MTTSTYCPTCGRTVKALRNGNTPRHLRLDKGQTCAGSGQPTTTDPETTTARRRSKPAKSTPKGKGKSPTPQRAARPAARSTAKRARDTIKAAEPGEASTRGEDDGSATEGTDAASWVATAADEEFERDVITRVAGQYPPHVKAEAVERMKTHGIASTHDMLGIPKATLSRWAREVNIDLGEAARSRTAHAALARRQALEEARRDVVPMLEQHLADFGHYLSQVARINAEAAQAIINAGPDAIERKVGLAGPYVVVTDDEAAAASNLAMALAGLPLSVRDAEGVVTRAVHDLQLLKGEATERGELVVNFGGIPRPRPTEVEVLELEGEPLDGGTPPV